MARPKKTDTPDIAERINLTAGAIERLACPVDKQQAFMRDSQAPGLRVRVTDTNTGRTRVNIRVPTSLVGAGLKMGMRLSPEIEGLDTEQIMQFIEAGTVGKIIDVTDDKDGEQVEVFLE